MSVTGGPVVWVKYKYLAPKSSGRYKGNSNGSSLKKREGQRKKSPQPPSDYETVMVIKKTGKTSWETRRKTGK